jgi:hypothetical protein
MDMDIDTAKALAARSGINLMWSSIDADPSGERVLAIGIFEDPSCPEAWVFFANGAPPCRLDRPDPGIAVVRPEDVPDWAWGGHVSLLDMPQGLVCWAVNGKDIVWKDADSDYCRYFGVDDSAWALDGTGNDEYQPTEFERARLSSMTLYP